MSKLTNLEITNAVLKNVGEATVSALTSLTGIQLVAWDAIQDVVMEIAHQSRWRPLESLGTFTLVTSTATYTETSNLMYEDVESFRVPDNEDNIAVLTPQEWDSNYPKGIGTDTTGYPTAIMRYGGYFFLNKYPTTTENTKIVHFRYYQRPVLFGTGSTTGTCWFPEGTDYTVLINLATYKVMHYKDNPEAQVYYNKVYGRGGTMERMNAIYSKDQGRLKARVTYAF